MKTGMILLTLVIMTVPFAYSTSPAAKVKDRSESKIAESVERGIQLNSLVFTGTVTQIENGLALVTRKATYLLSGDGLEEVIGKQVNIIGKLEKKDATETIIVIRYQLAKDS